VAAPDGYPVTMTTPPRLDEAARERWADEAARERWADELLDRLTPAMSVLGLLFLLVVLGEDFARDGSALGAVLTVVGWLLWGVFAAEFLARLIVAPDKRRFWRRSWWQLLFLVLPFLRILRLVRAVRLLRTGRILSSAVRSSRSARAVLGGRVGWLAAVTAITVLGSSQLLYEFSGYQRYGDALHAAALATITGASLGQPDGFALVLEVVLAAFSVVVFATLAGSLGAYFLETRAQPTPPALREGQDQ
jgi:voltage-gated potassium channel